MTDDPRIDLLAQAAGDRCGGIDPVYYKLAAKEFLAFADALEEHYYAGDMPPPVETAQGPEPAYPIDVREERARTTSVIGRALAGALRIAATKAHEGDKPAAATAVSIAIELQSLLDELA